MVPSRVLTCTPVELSRERRETLGVEVRGWFGAEAATWLRMLAGQRASDVQAAMRAGARATWVARWSGLLAVAAQRAVAASLLELPLAGECNVAGEALELREVLADVRWQLPTIGSRLRRRHMLSRWSMRATSTHGQCM